MQKRSWPFIILLLNSIAFAADDIDPIVRVKTFIHKSFLKIPDGREIIISQPGKKPEFLKPLNFLNRFVLYF